MVSAAVLAGCLAESGEPRERHEAPAAPPGWPALVWPADNPYHPDKVELGRRLFYESALSGDGVVTCAWCHSERASFADNHQSAFSTGIDMTPMRRNTPALVNVGFGTSFMLAGEAGSLEEQALMPLLAPDEMGGDSASIVALVAGDGLYGRLLRNAFGPGGATLQNVARALAAYQRTLISASSPYDAWSAGDESALTPAQRRGAALFFGKAACATCHAPPLFTDRDFHNIGLDREPADSGRSRVTGLAADVGKFRTPTLRNVLFTAPYMHDGRFADLRTVVEHYASGGQPHPNRDSRLPAGLLNGGDVDDLLEFLVSLTDHEFISRHEL